MPSLCFGSFSQLVPVTHIGLSHLISIIVSPQKRSAPASNLLAVKLPLRRSFSMISKNFEVSLDARYYDR